MRVLSLTSFTSRLLSSARGLRARSFVRLGGVAGLALAAACSSGSDDGGGGAQSATPDGGVCPDGFAISEAAAGACVEILPQGACAPGSAPFIGQATCVPLGPPACSDGFVPDPSGWGCADVTPAAACDGPTREKLGSEACAPLGACGGAPPGGALVVDASLDPGLVDATHFRSIGAAVAAAGSGAVVWVKPGTYAETLSVTKPITLEGECAEKVILTAPGAASPGIHVSGSQEVTVRGFTLRGYTRALDLAAANVTLEDSWVDESVAAGVFLETSQATVRRTKISGTHVGTDGKWGWGIAAGDGSRVLVDDSTLTGGVDGVFAATKGTVVTIQGSVIARQAPTSGTRSSGVDVVSGGKAIVTHSVVRDVQGDGAVVADGGHGEVTDSVLRGTRVQGSQARGHGVVAIAGGTLVVRSTTVADTESISLDAQQASSRLEVYDSVVRGPSVSHAVVDSHLGVSSDRSGIGMQVIDQATSKLDGVAILGAWGFGLYVETKGSLEAHHLFVDDTHDLKTPEVAGSLAFAVGLTVDKQGKATLSDSTVLHGRLAGVSSGAEGTLEGTAVLLRDVGPADPVGTGAGISVGEGGTATLSRSAIVDTSGVGVLASNGGDSTLSLVDCTVHGVTPNVTGFGHGAMAGPSTTFDITRTTFFDNGAVALAMAGGSARVTASSFVHNPIALHVQDGSYLVQSDADDPLGAGELRVSEDSTFVANGTKVGTDATPLPEDPLQ